MADEKEKKVSDEESQKLKSKFQSDLKEARSYMDPIQQRMDMDYRAYRNDRTTVDDCEFQISDLFTYVETVVPIVTNNRIRANVRSDYPEYVTHAKGENDILDNTYDINNWDYTSQQVMRTALIYRSSFAYTGFDKKYKNGVGKLCIDLVNPRWCLVDPAATELEDSRFFFYVEPKRKTEMYKMYPNKKDDIDKAIGSSNGNPWAGTQNSGTSWFKTWVNTVKNRLTFNKDATAAKSGYPFLMQSEIDEQEKHKNVVAHIHYWYRGDDDEWRCSYWADDCPLKDEKNPFWHGGLPYDIYSPVKDPLSMLGIPMSEQMDSMNQQRNALMQYVIDNAKLHADPELLFNTAFGNVKDPERLGERSNGRGPIRVNNPDNLPLNAIAEYMIPPTMPGYVTGLFDQLGGIEDKISGVNDSFRGTQQASSGKEVQLQQEAAYTRIKTMIDQFELFNKKIAEKIIVNAMQFYTTNRGFRIKGDYTKYDMDKKIIESQGKQMPFEVEPIQNGVSEEGQPQYDRTEFFLYANPNEWTKLKPEEGEDNDEEERDETSGSGEYAEERMEDSVEGKEEVAKAFKILQMTVEIEAGSSLPQSRLARREEAVQLAQMGFIDQESVLEMYDWPDREEVMKRMNEKSQQQAEAQQQAAQAEAQAKAQAEQAKLQQQMQLEQMKLQADAQKTQANNQAKIEQQQVSNKGKVAEQGMENSGSSIVQVLDEIRQANPEAANIPDEQLIQLLTQTG